MEKTTKDRRNAKKGRKRTLISKNLRKNGEKQKRGRGEKTEKPTKKEPPKELI